MSRVVSIHQPNFMPWSGYFHKIALSDVFVFFDDVQYPRGKSFVNRVLIKVNNGTSWLNVPIRASGHFQSINKVQIDNSVRWSEKMLKTIGLVYRRSAFFDWLYPELAQRLAERHEWLVDLNESLIKFLAMKAGIETNFVKATELDTSPHQSPENRIPEIVKSVDGTCYLSGKGKGSMRYISESTFAEFQIRLQYQEFNHPVYSQLHGQFVPNLSFIDLLFNCGPESLSCLQGNSI